MDAHPHPITALSWFPSPRWVTDRKTGRQLGGRASSGCCLCLHTAAAAATAAAAQQGRGGATGTCPLQKLHQQYSSGVVPPAKHRAPAHMCAGHTRKRNQHSGRGQYTTTHSCQHHSHNMPHTPQHASGWQGHTVATAARMWGWMMHPMLHSRLQALLPCLPPSCLAYTHTRTPQTTTKPPTTTKT